MQSISTQTAQSITNKAIELAGLDPNKPLSTEILLDTEELEHKTINEMEYLASLRKSPSDWYQQALKNNQERKQLNDVGERAFNESNNRVLEELKSWEIPSPEHQELKNACIKEIQDKIKVGYIPYYDVEETFLEEGPWISREEMRVESKIRQLRTEIQQKIEERNNKQLWLDLLRSSLIRP